MTVYSVYFHIRIRSVFIYLWVEYSWAPHFGKDCLVLVGRFGGHYVLSFRAHSMPRISSCFCWSWSSWRLETLGTLTTSLAEKNAQLVCFISLCTYFTVIIQVMFIILTPIIFVSYFVFSYFLHPILAKFSFMDSDIAVCIVLQSKG